jgi:hypothetical protein
MGADPVTAQVIITFRFMKSSLNGNSVASQSGSMCSSIFFTSEKERKSGDLRYRTKLPLNHDQIFAPQRPGVSKFDPQSVNCLLSKALFFHTRQIETKVKGGRCWTRVLIGLFLMA